MTRVRNGVCTKHGDQFMSCWSDSRPFCAACGAEKAQITLMRAIEKDMRHERQPSSLAVLRENDT